MRYRTKSADVLNEADRFQRIMEWQLFCSEQENQLWGYDPDQEWTPGMPMYPRPYRIDIYDCECVLCDNYDAHDDEYGHHYFGNHVRPMFELFEDREGRVWCTTCEVTGDWSETSCWMCGEEWDDQPTKSYNSVSEVAVATDALRSMMVQANRFSERLGAQLTAYASAMRGFDYRQIYVMHPRRNGFTHMHSVMDEYNAWDVETTGLTYSLKPYNPPPASNPFVKEDKTIELVPPVAADTSKFTGGWDLHLVRIPADVDLSGRVMPALPQMPKSEVRPLPTGYGPPTTHRWRNR